MKGSDEKEGRGRREERLKGAQRVRGKGEENGGRKRQSASATGEALSTEGFSQKGVVEM